MKYRVARMVGADFQVAFLAFVALQREWPITYSWVTHRATGKTHNVLVTHSMKNMAELFPTVTTSTNLHVYMNCFCNLYRQQQLLYLKPAKSIWVQAVPFMKYSYSHIFEHVHMWQVTFHSIRRVDKKTVQNNASWKKLDEEMLHSENNRYTQHVTQGYHLNITYICSTIAHF